mgnify:FL=1
MTVVQKLNGRLEYERARKVGFGSPHPLGCVLGVTQKYFPKIKEGL